MMHGKHAPSNIKNEWFDLNVSQVFNFKEECKQCEEILKALHDNPFI